MEIKYVSVNDLIPYEYNNKIHDQKQVNRIANSIKEFGFLQPLVIDSSNILIVGHGRLEAAKKLGMEEVPCIKAENLTKEQIKKFRILDNKLNESERNIDNLRLELEELGYDMSYGDLEEDVEELFWDLLSWLTEEDKIEDIKEDAPYVPEVEEEAKLIKKGDIIQLWNHRLMCWDSATQDVDFLLWWELADMVMTDPPYNVDYSSKNEYLNKSDKGNRVQKAIENDHIEDFEAFLANAYSYMVKNTKDGWAFYVRHSEKEDITFKSLLQEAGVFVHQTLIWVKNNFVLGRMDYQPKHEPCLYGWKEWAWHYFIDNRSNTSVFEDKADFKKMSKGELIKMLKDIYDGWISTSVIHEDKPLSSALHPTMKPIKLLARLIVNSTKEWESVLDTFGGSGSTLIACEQLKRKCYMMEYDPKYVEVIIRRFHQLSPEANITCTNRNIDLKELWQ